MKNNTYNNNNNNDKHHHHFLEDEKKNNLSKALKENISKRKKQTKLRLKIKK